MGSSDKKVRRLILQKIADVGSISKMQALRMCESSNQLERIIALKKGLLERNGYITTQEELDDALGTTGSALLNGNDTNGVGGIHALRGI